jgi:predicted nucleotidyltransferase
LDAVDFKYAYERSELKKVDGLDIRVVGLDDLILLKRAAAQGRSKARDSEDLTFLEKLKSRLTSGKSF